jgi:hypothetical protein
MKLPRLGVSVCRRQMAHIEGEIVIKRPPEELFDFVADERNEPRFNPRMIRAEMLTDEPVREGSRFRTELKTRAGTTEMTIENTGYDRPRRLASTTRLSNMEIRGTLFFEAVPEGTRMRWVWDLQAGGFLRFMDPVVAWMGRRQEREIWTNLKSLLEGEPCGPGG